MELRVLDGGWLEVKKNVQRGVLGKESFSWSEDCWYLSPEEFDSLLSKGEELLAMMKASRVEARGKEIRALELKLQAMKEGKG